MSGTGTKKFETANELYKWNINDPVIRVKALKILKVYNYLFRPQKSQLTNQCCDFKELLQRFEEHRLVNL